MHKSVSRLSTVCHIMHLDSCMCYGVSYSVWRVSCCFLCAQLLSACLSCTQGITRNPHHSQGRTVVTLLHLCKPVPCVCSYLGYGLMAGRAAVLAWEEARKANPCVPTDHSVSPTPTLTPAVPFAPHSYSPSQPVVAMSTFCFRICL